MGLITKQKVQEIADRAAWQYGQVKEAFEGINATGVSGSYGAMVLGSNDADVCIPMLGYMTDTADTGVLLSRAISGLPALTGIPSNIESHLTRMSFTGGLPTYLTAQGLRVSDYFNQVYKATRSTGLYANSVFSENADVFGSVERVSGPAVVFTDGTDYGNGAATNRADGSYFAATQLKVVVMEDMGVSDLELTITGKDTANQVKTQDVLVPGGASEGDEVEVGTALDRWLDVTGVALAGTGKDGSVGDLVEIRNLKERQVGI